MNQAHLGDRAVLNELIEDITEKMDSVGILYRVFGRVKTPYSIENKTTKKEYSSTTKKIQDFFGIRITVYFSDDEQIAINLIGSLFEEITESRSVDKPDLHTFRPQRCNMIYKLPDKFSEYETPLPYIDRTLELQFRTILSEGWHEVEHDLRYKCIDDWEKEDILSRTLNGQLASLEAVNWAMMKVFENLSYNKYKSKDWSAFFRSHFRIRFVNSTLSPQIVDFLNNNRDFAKEVLKTERQKLIVSLSVSAKKLPLTMDNVLFAVNHFIIKNEEFIKLESELIKRILLNSTQK